MSGVKIQIDNQKYSATKFAGEIKLNDVLKNIKNIDKCIVEAMFNDIAGEDGVIQGTELEAFMHKLEKASGDDKNLSPQECEKFARSREKGLLGKFAASSRASLYMEFIKQLFNTNSQKVAQEEKAAENTPKPQIPVDKFYENGKLVKKIIHKEDGTTVEQQFKNGRLTREITKDKDGKIKKDKTIDKDGNQTFHRKVNEGYTVEKFTIYDKNNKKIGEGTVDESGTKSTNYLQDSKVVKNVTEYSDGDVSTEYYNKDGTPKERVYVNNHGYRSVTKYFYDEKGNKTKEVSSDSNGTTSTSTFNEKGIQKTIEKHKDGTVKTITYKDGNEYQPAKEVQVDSKGNKWITEYTYTSASYEAAKIVTKDGNGKVTYITTRKFNKEGGVIEETDKDGNGKLLEVSKYDGKGNLKQSTHYSHNGDVETTTFGKNVYKSEIRDKDGNLKSTTEEVKNAKGETVKVIKKDANGQVTETTDYTSSGWVMRDGKGQILATCEETKNANGKLLTYKNNKGQVTSTSQNNDNGYLDTEYIDGKPYCSHEYNRTTKTSVYKDAQGNEISASEYIELVKNAKRARTER